MSKKVREKRMREGKNYEVDEKLFKFNKAAEAARKQSLIKEFIFPFTIF